VPGVGAISTIGVNLFATDLAANNSSVQAALINFSQIVSAPAPVSWAASGMLSWRVTPNTVASCTPGATLVSRATTGVTAANPTSVTLSAAVLSPATTLDNPFTSRVEFWVQPAGGGTWRKIGAAGPPSVVEFAGIRSWTFFANWTPDAYTAPFASNPSATDVNIIAIGINLNGDALATPMHTGYRVTVP
jgi:hypothetical protein